MTKEGEKKLTLPHLMMQYLVVSSVLLLLGWARCQTWTLHQQAAAGQERKSTIILSVAQVICLFFFSSPVTCKIEEPDNDWKTQGKKRKRKAKRKISQWID